MKLNTLAKSLFVGATFVFTSASVIAETAVWKVTKGNDYIYVGGTVHLLPESAFPLPKEFEQAYANTDSLVLEAQMPAADDVAAQTALIQAMAYQDGRTLSQVLSPDVYQMVSDYFAPYGVQLQQLESYKPGFIMLQMLALEMMKAQMAG